MIADRAIQQITVADLERLVSNGVAESRTLEYKEALPGGADQDKREFLADVSSFANAIGGDLVYGVREKRDETGKPTGTPEAIVGIDVGNLDQGPNDWRTCFATGSHHVFPVFGSGRSVRSSAALR